jgi:hypothetical protein
LHSEGDIIRYVHLTVIFEINLTINLSLFIFQAPPKQHYSALGYPFAALGSFDVPLDKLRWLIECNSFLRLRHEAQSVQGLRFKRIEESMN